MKGGFSPQAPGEFALFSWNGDSLELLAPGDLRAAAKLVLDINIQPNPLFMKYLAVAERSNPATHLLIFTPATMRSAIGNNRMRAPIVKDIVEQQGRRMALVLDISPAALQGHSRLHQTSKLVASPSTGLGMKPGPCKSLGTAPLPASSTCCPWKPPCFLTCSQLAGLFTQPTAACPSYRI